MAITTSPRRSMANASRPIRCSSTVTARTFDPADVSVFDMKGNRLQNKAWRDKFKNDVHALVAYDGKLPNPRELALFKDDALLVVLPAERRARPPTASRVSRHHPRPSCQPVLAGVSSTHRTSGPPYRPRRAPHDRRMRTRSRPTEPRGARKPPADAIRGRFRFDSPRPGRMAILSNRRVAAPSTEQG